MEFGKKYKIIYRDGNYSKIIKTRILSDNGTFFETFNHLDGRVYLNKEYIVSYSIIPEEIGYVGRKDCNSEKIFEKDTILIKSTGKICYICIDDNRYMTRDIKENKKYKYLNIIDKSDIEIVSKGGSTHEDYKVKP